MKPLVGTTTPRAVTTDLPLAVLTDNNLVWGLGSKVQSSI